MEQDEEMGETKADAGVEPRKSKPAAPGIARRDFIALSSLGLAAAFDAAPAMAGPFAPSDFESLVPADKRLRPEWVRSLFARGERTVYTSQKNELRYIGMPVGGICCGTLYLGGDGQLWLWDIFNENKLGILPRSVRFNAFGEPRDIDPVSGSAFVAPHDEESPIAQGFALKIGDTVRPFSAAGWKSIAFQGEYPVGTVTYRDADCPVSATLTAYSPFIPLNADDSGLPATVCEFTVRNESKETIDVEIGAWIENGCSRLSAHLGDGDRVNTVSRAAAATIVGSRFEPVHLAQPAVAHPDIVIDDFERPTYAPWKVEGSAFGSGPILRTAIPSYQGDVGGSGDRVVNSHASAPGATVEEKDSRTGKLTSPAFLVERRYLSFYVGGGSNVDVVGIRLLVNGEVVQRAAGNNDNRMRKALFDVADYRGKQAVIEIYDNGTGGWGNIGVDRILQTDASDTSIPPERERDFGTMALALLGSGLGKADAPADAVFAAPPTDEARRPVGTKLIGAVTSSIRLLPGASKTVTFVVAWHFTNTGLGVRDAQAGAYYAVRFANAAAVAEYVARNYARLAKETKLWRDVWYDSTLPFWFLDRTFANTSILATSTAHRFGTGRFWGWEGIGCCEGTCTHVWHYAQAVGRIFPELERVVRERVDFGAAFNAKTGLIGYRGEGTGPAIDGQCGRILSVLREHRMSADDSFLRRLWPQVRQAIVFLMGHDSDADGLLEGPQDNTLDAAWYGKIAWISSLYLAALRAGEAMAHDAGDADFERTCAERSQQTQRAIETELFNGEYFIQKPEPGREGSLGTYGACHIDQVHGQSWAWQAGLGRILDRKKTLSALSALYRYNFAPDVGPFRRKNHAGRLYALAGDGGLIMATNPRDTPHAFGNAADWQFGYFNECMSGFEHQAASHMIAEGLLLEGMAVTRAIHDRYHAARRNPYNEVECSDHYARSMASYGSFVSICGFEYDGPKGRLGFSPRLTPESFRAPFITAEGWGTYAQQRDGAGRTHAQIRLRHGKLRLKDLVLAGHAPNVAAAIDGKPTRATVAVANGRCVVTFSSGITLRAGQTLTVTPG